MARLDASEYKVWKEIEKGARVRSPYAKAVLTELVFGIPRVLAFWIIFSVLLALLGAYALTASNSSFFRFADIGDNLESVGGLAFALSLLVSYWQILRSIWSLRGNVSARATAGMIGARHMSLREQKMVFEVRKSVLARNKDKPHLLENIKAFSGVFVTENLGLSIFTVGDCLFVASGTIRDSSFPALYAHELGHLNGKDGDMLIAMRSFYTLRMQRDESLAKAYATHESGKTKLLEAEEYSDRLMGSFAGKTIETKLTNMASFTNAGVSNEVRASEWAQYFQARDYIADYFAKQLGFGDELIQVLDGYKINNATHPYMLGWQASSELRMDALINPHEYGFDGRTVAEIYEETATAEIGSEGAYEAGKVIANFKKQAQQTASNIAQEVRSDEGLGKVAASAAAAAAVAKKKVQEKVEEVARPAETPTPVQAQVESDEGIEPRNVLDPIMSIFDNLGETNPQKIKDFVNGGMGQAVINVLEKGGEFNYFGLDYTNAPKVARDDYDMPNLKQIMSTFGADQPASQDLQNKAFSEIATRLKFDDLTTQDLEKSLLVLLKVKTELGQEMKAIA